MKKQLFVGIMFSLAMVNPFHGTIAAQTTEGTDFWVTLMRGDSRNYDSLFLSFSAKEATKVYVANAQNNYYDTIVLGNNAIKKLNLNAHSSSCYITDSECEKPAYRALHVTSDKPISLIAANYKDKSFDVASILPTSALMSEYRIQCYSPSAHENTSQGSQFAIVAADDNTFVDITLTVSSSTGKKANTTFTTEALQRGQVYYVWTGNGEGDGKDFTGTVVKARGNKKIAVFNGNSHTNIPNKVRDRDHIYSQAMPINYWGKRFAITSSLTTIDGQPAGSYWERIDKIRVQALVDGTTVYIDGDSVYTFDFASNPKHYYEFDFGAKDSKTVYSGDGHRYFEGTSHYVETSCPSAVHLFMTSDRYDHDKDKSINDKYCNGDPSLIWINPIEQKIKKLTFGTFETKQVKDHFINIVTTADNINSIELDGTNIASEFKPLAGNPAYMFARITAVQNGTHTLVSDSGFIAHVYGFGEKESYGYPAGGETKDLTAFITINGNEYHADGDNNVCGGEDKVVFGCKLNYDYDSIYWNFGDQHDTIATQIDSVEHHYSISGTYKAYVLIYRTNADDDGCIGLLSYDSIPFHVNVGNYQMNIKKTELPYCTMEGEEVEFKVILDNPGDVSLTSDSVSLKFNATAINDGFKDSDISITGDTMLVLQVPSTAKGRKVYGLHLHIGSDCPSNTLDTVLGFSLQFDIPLLTQRYNNVLGLLRDSFPTQELSNFVWYHDGDTVPGQKTSVLYLDENNPANSGEYCISFHVHEDGMPDYDYMTCPITFHADTSTHSFAADSTITISASYSVAGDVVFVNVDYQGRTNIQSYIQWIDTGGKIYARYDDIPDGGRTIPTPKEGGLYLLRVVTGNSTRSFKFLINK